MLALADRPVYRIKDGSAVADVGNIADFERGDILRQEVKSMEDWKFGMMEGWIIGFPLFLYSSFTLFHLNVIV